MSSLPHLPSMPVVAAVVGTAIASFAVALWLGPAWNIWVTTGAAASATLAIGWMSAGQALRAQLVTTPRGVAQGLAGGILLTGVTHLSYALTAPLVPGLSQEVRRLYDLLEAPPGPLAAIPILTAVVLAEELVWRGILLPALRTRLRAWPAIALATVLYALPQLASSSWVLVAAALGCGAVWTLQRERSGSLVVPTVTHLTWDILVFVAFPLGAST